MDELIKAAFAKWLTEQGLLTNGVISDRISEVDIREAFAAGLSQQAGQWHPINSEDDLPKEPGRYLVSFKAGTINGQSIGFDDVGQHFRLSPFRNFWLEHYSAWQVEPAPYKPE